jgi:hypothetical protein
MSDKLYQGISFWMMTFAIALWGITIDRTVIEPSHIIMATLAASIWTFAFAWGSMSAATESLSNPDKCIISAIGVVLLTGAVVATLLGWPRSVFFRDAPIIVIPMSVGIGLAYMFGTPIRRHLPEAKRVAAQEEGIF